MRTSPTARRSGAYLRRRLQSEGRRGQIAELFQTTPQNVTLHLKAIFAEGELAVEATCKDYLQVRVEGGREVTRSLRHYEAGGQPCQGLCTVRPAMCSKSLVLRVARGWPCARAIAAIWASSVEMVRPAWRRPVTTFA